MIERARLRASAALVAAAALAGCAQGLPVTREVVVPGGRFEAIRGEAQVVVRSFVEEADGRREVGGARCDLATSLYSAALVTPARLYLPNFGPQSPDLRVACTAPGLAGTAQQRIVTRTQGAGSARYGYFGSSRRDDFVFGWGWPSLAFPVSDYPNIAVTLRPTGAATTLGNIAGTGGFSE